ncbi:MAG: rhomboid family intramembrane serine protease [Planctomycetota bacterium]|jgi:rhomboid protease GluP|nr:rhomboid family intramembrane serine protease [Planctomycetota bacterium]
MADWYFRNSQTNSVKACPECGNLVRADQEFCPYCARRLGPERGARGWLKRALAAPAIATKGLIGAIAVFFFLQSLTDMLLPASLKSDAYGGLLGLSSAYPATYALLGANHPRFILEYGQVWRFFTSCLLHFGFIHILFNCWALWDLGRIAEKLWGARQVFAVFVLTGICGSAASFAWNGLVLHRPVTSAGASGAICGILGLFLGTYYRNRFHLGQILGANLVRWAVYIIVFGLVMQADNAAHIGGMISGAAFGYFLVPAARARRPALDAKIWTGLAVFALVVAVVCLAFMGAYYVPHLFERRIP